MSEIWNRGLDLEYDDAEMSFFSTNFPGITLEPDIIDPLEEDFPLLKVKCLGFCSWVFVLCSIYFVVWVAFPKLGFNFGWCTVAEVLVDP